MFQSHVSLEEWRFMMFREVCFEAVRIEVLKRWTYNCSWCFGRVSPISVATRNDISAGISIMSFQPYPPNYPCPMQQKSDDLDLPTQDAIVAKVQL